MTLGSEFFEAVRLNDPEAIESLFRREGSALLKARERAGFGPVAEATALGAVEALKALLACGADPNEIAKDRSRPRALHCLVDAGRSRDWARVEGRDVGAAVRVLLAAGADLEARDAEGRTPLWYAVKRRHLEAVSLLLECGADPNATDCDEVSALAEATRTRRTDIVETLLEAGADPNRWTHYAQSALYLAAVHPARGAMEALIRHGARVAHTGALHAVAVTGSMSRLKLLLDHGGDVHEHNMGGQSVLHCAVASAYAAGRVPLLLKRGADPNDRARDRVGMTPLHAAACYVPLRLGVLEALVRAGGDIEVVDDQGYTPIDRVRRVTGGARGAERLQAIARERGLFSGVAREDVRTEESGPSL